MKKTIINLTAIYLLLLGLLGIILNIILFIELFIKPTNSPFHENLLILLMWLSITGWYIATGICLYKKHYWVRYSLLALSICSIIFGIITCFVLSTTFNWFARLSTSKMIILAMIIIFLFFLPIIKIIIFTRKPIKELFINTNEMNIRPLGISFLAIFFFIGGLIGIYSAIYPSCRFILIIGYQVSGWNLKLYLLITAFITIYIAFGFWKMQRIAWFLFITLSCYDIINGLFNFLTFRSEVYLQMCPSIQNFNPVLSKLIFLVNPIFTTIALIYIISKKSIFSKEKPI